MDHERFDELAKTLSSGASRRKMIGGAIAGLVGAGVAKVSGTDAKGKKKNGKRKAGKEATCTPNPCPAGSCCSPTPPGSGVSCTDIITQITTGTICGDANGEGVCRTCPEGTRCALDPVTGDLSCVCSRATCATGCCIPGAFIGQRDDVCVQNGSGNPVNLPFPFNGVFVCGTGGGVCNICSDVFGPRRTGCCDANGACRVGTENIACGAGGQTCATCQNDSTCGVDQACTGATTTTTTTTAGPCADGRPRCTTGGLSVCCEAKFVCTGSGCVRKKKKKKHKKHHH
jgi:hypothetical protein